MDDASTIISPGTPGAITEAAGILIDRLKVRKELGTTIEPVIIKPVNRIKRPRLIDPMFTKRGGRK